MTVTETPGVPQAAKILRPRTIPSHTQLPAQVPHFSGQSQRADNLADMLSLDRLIRQGLHEDWALRLSRATAESTRQRMLMRARSVLEITRQSW